MYAKIIHLISSKGHNLCSGFYLGKDSVLLYRIKDHLLRNVPKWPKQRKFRKTNAKEKIRTMEYN